MPAAIALTQELADGRDSGSRDHALGAYPCMPLEQMPPEGDLDLVARGERDVPRLGRDGQVAAPVPDEHGHAQAGAGADQRHVRLRDRASGLKHDPVLGQCPSHAETERLEIVQDERLDPDSGFEHAPADPPGGTVGKSNLAALNGPGGRNRGARRRERFPVRPPQLADIRLKRGLEARKASRCVRPLETDARGIPFDVDDRKARVRGADVGGENPYSRLPRVSGRPVKLACGTHLQQGSGHSSAVVRVRAAGSW